MTDWLLDELAHAGDEHLDPDFVAGFDRKQRFDPTPDIEALQALGLSPASTVVDFAAGTGKLAVALAPFCREVIAVDISAAMIAALREAAAAAAVPNLRVEQSGLLTYEHRGPQADFAYCRNALHQLPDFWKALALRRIASTLRPGGVLLLRDLVYDFEPDEVEQRLEAWFAGAVSNPAEGYTRDDLALHVRSEHSTFRWLLEPILERCGFEVLDAAYVRGVYASYTCRRH